MVSWVSPSVLFSNQSVAGTVHGTLAKSLGSWTSNGVTMPVIAIGPKGGKIVAYDAKGKPVYAGTTQAVQLAKHKKKKVAGKEVPAGKFADILDWLKVLKIGVVSFGPAGVVVAKETIPFMDSIGAQPLVPGSPAYEWADLLAAQKATPKVSPDKKAQTVAGKAEDAWPSLLTLKEVPAGKFAGTHGNRLFEAPDGRRFLFKGENELIARAEEASSRIGEMLLGPGKIQKTKYVNLDGTPGVLVLVEDVVPLAQAGKDIPKAKLITHTTDILQHYVLDWVLGQHDTHAENLQVKVDGSGLLAIDKGQAFKLIGKDKLDWTYQPNEHPQVYGALKKVGLPPAVQAAQIVAPVLARLESLTTEQRAAVVAPYVAAYGKKHGSDAAAKMKKKILARFASARKDWEEFLGQKIPVTPVAAAAPQPKPAPKAKLAKVPLVLPPTAAVPEKMQDGFTPTKKGTVTLLKPGSHAKPGGWPPNYPGPGYAAQVTYKKQTSLLEFQYGDDGGMEVKVTYPDGTYDFFTSPNAACDSLYLHAKGLPLQMSAAEKKKKGISYSATKMLKLKDFAAELHEHASIGEEVAVPDVDAATASHADLFEKHGPGVLGDYSILPWTLQEIAKDLKSQVVLEKLPHDPPAWFVWMSHYDAGGGYTEYVKWIVTQDGLQLGMTSQQSVPEALKGTVLVGKDAESFAAILASPPPKAKPIPKTPAKLDIPDTDPAQFSGPLPPGSSVTVQKKFETIGGKVSVVLEALDDGTFSVTLPQHASLQKTPEKFATLSAASDWVWVNQKGYANAEAYKKATGKKKVPSGGGWKFWGLQPTAAPPPPPAPPPAPGVPETPPPKVEPTIPSTPVKGGVDVLKPTDLKAIDLLEYAPGTQIVLHMLVTDKPVEWRLTKKSDGEFAAQAKMTGAVGLTPSVSVDISNALLMIQQSVTEIEVSDLFEGTPVPGEWVELAAGKLSEAFLHAVPPGTEFSIAHAVPGQPAIDAEKKWTTDGAWKVYVEGELKTLSGLELATLVAEKSKGKGVFKTLASTAGVPAASEFVDAQPEDLPPQKAHHPVQADVSFIDAFKYLPEVAHHPDFELNPAFTGNAHILLFKLGNDTVDTGIAKVQKILDTYGLKPGPGQPKANSSIAWALISDDQLQKTVSVTMPAAKVPPVDVKNNFETMPEVESPAGKKLPKKILKGWTLKKKLAQMGELPVGAVLSLGNGMKFQKTEKVNGFEWQSLFVADAKTGDPGAKYPLTDYAVAMEVGIQGGAAVSQNAQAAKTVKVQKPAKKVEPPAPKPLPVDPAKEQKKAWLAAHPPLTPLTSKHLARLLHDKKVPGLLVYARMAGDDVVFGDGLPAFAEFLGMAGKLEAETTPYGTLYRLPLEQLVTLTPGAGTVKGPDGVSYPHGTTFDSEETFATVKQSLEEEAGFQKFSPGKPGTGVAEAAKFTKGTDVAGLQAKYGAGKLKFGSNYSMLLLSQAELDKDHGPAKVTVTPKIPPQAAPLKFLSLGVLTEPGPQGSPAPVNREDLGEAASVVPTRHGYSIRFGRGGVLMDGQLRMHKVEMPDGKRVLRFVGELTKDAPNLSSMVQFQFLSSTTKPEEHIPGKLANDFDPETGTHKLTKETTWHSDQSTGAILSGKAMVYTFNNHVETLRRTFVVDVPEDGNPEQALLEAMVKLGVPADEAMALPDAQDERILCKTQLLRSHIGATGFSSVVNLDLMSLDRDQREKVLDGALKGKISKAMVDTARVEVGPEGTHVVVADDLDLDPVSCLATGISAEGVARAILQGAYGGQAQTLWTGNSKNLGATTSGYSDMTTGGGFGKYFVLYNDKVKASKGVGAGKAKLILHPRVLKRTNWYAHSSDQYGTQKSEGLTRRGALKTGGPANEVLVETVGVADMAGALVSSAAEKKTIVDALTKAGMDEVNGIPLDEFVVVGNVLAPGKVADAGKIKGLQPGVLP